MAKVTTSEKGVQVTQVIENVKPKREALAPLEMKAGDGVSPPIVDGPETKKTPVTPPPEVAPQDDDHVDAEDKDLSDITIKEAQDKARRKIGKYAARWQAELRAKEQLASEIQEAERFGETLFNEREEWRKKAEAAEARAVALEASKPKAAEDVEPQKTDAKYQLANGEFDWVTFSDDRTEFKVKKALAADRKAQAEARQKAEQEATDREFQKSLAKAQAKYPDWDAKVVKSPIELQNEALAYIKQSQYGIDIAYFLASNPSESEKIKAMHPIRAIAAIRDIETGFEKPAAKPAPAPLPPSESVERQGAPAPITPIQLTGSNPPPVDPAKMDYKQLRAFRKEEARRLGKRM